MSKRSASGQPSDFSGASQGGLWRVALVAVLLSGGLIACSSRALRGGPDVAAAPSAAVSDAHAQSAPAASDYQVSAPADPSLLAAEQAYRSGLAALENRQWTNAESAFKALSASYPNFPGPQVNLGIVYRETGRLDEAEATLTRAAQRWPRFAPAQHQLGLLLRGQGKFEAANSAYGKALAADPNYAIAYYNRAVLNDLYLQNPTQALSDYQAYQRLRPSEDEKVARWIADLRRRTGAAAPAAEKATGEGGQP